MTATDTAFGTQYCILLYV